LNLLSSEILVSVTNQYWHPKQYNEILREAQGFLSENRYAGTTLATALVAPFYARFSAT
jgi:hypothetical protein